MENITALEFDATFKKIIKTLITLEKATRNDEEINYKPLYLSSFNGISDVLEYLYIFSKEHDTDKLSVVIEATMQKLQDIQKRTEEMFIEQMP